MKIAQVQVQKKNSTLDKGNYRLVSLLPVISKIFERAMYTQLIEHFSNIFNPLLGAFRPVYGCSTTLLKVAEDWKQALDENFYLCAVLRDLSKAFDCLPHDLLLLKCRHYDLSESSVTLIQSHLSFTIKTPSMLSQFCFKNNFVLSLVKKPLLRLIALNLTIVLVFLAVSCTKYW